MHSNELQIQNDTKLIVKHVYTKNTKKQKMNEKILSRESTP